MRTILWDFDGVILDSMAVRDFGFREIFNQFDPESIEELITYHRKNGGLSRYVKIRYFYEQILGKTIDEDEIQHLAGNFSSIMKEKLTDPNNLINDSVDFIKNNNNKFNFHIVSGSDQTELRFLCKKLDLEKFFITINGSPTPKTELVQQVMDRYAYQISETCLIGDSINDYEAANANDILFYGYNNNELTEVSENYITSFKDFSFY